MILPDPVSVVGMLRRIGLPGPIQAVFAGESLFNDGVGVVVFGVATGDGSTAGGTEIATRFVFAALGGGLLGLALGWVAVQFMRAIDDAHLELILQLALATGTFSLAGAFGMSAPIAVVVARLTLGSRRSRTSISAGGHKEPMTFWSLVDEVLNALLFLLIGFEVAAVAFRLSHIAAVLIAIPLSIAVRALSVIVATLPVYLRGPGRGGALMVLIWAAFAAAFR